MPVFQPHIPGDDGCAVNATVRTLACVPERSNAKLSLAEEASSPLRIPPPVVSFQPSLRRRGDVMNPAHRM